MDRRCSWALVLAVVPTCRAILRARLYPLFQLAVGVFGGTNQGLLGFARLGFMGQGQPGHSAQRAVVVDLVGQRERDSRVTSSTIPIWDVFSVQKLIGIQPCLPALNGQADQDGCPGDAIEPRKPRAFPPAPVSQAQGNVTSGMVMAAPARMVRV